MSQIRQWQVNSWDSLVESQQALAVKTAEVEYLELVSDFEANLQLGL
jgi:phenylalanine-4-hydroxylase